MEALMESRRFSACARVVLLVTILCCVYEASQVKARSFEILNNCRYQVWPGFLSNAGVAPLSTTGFMLNPGESITLNVPEGWSGRMWGRTGCVFDSDGKGSCATADCGGQLQCNGAGAVPPASLAEFTLGQGSALDFYDVSLVDGYNLPMLVAANGGTGACNPTGCITDLNKSCPKELQIDASSDGAGACKSACEAFNEPQYCCSGAYGNPTTCKPTSYSQLFKTACPRAYSYAYDDSTSTFTCAGADYAIIFCPSVAMANYVESKQNASPATPGGSTNPTTTTETNGEASPLFYGGGTSKESYASSSASRAERFHVYIFIILSALLMTALARTQ